MRDTIMTDTERQVLREQINRHRCRICTGRREIAGGIVECKFGRDKARSWVEGICCMFRLDEGK